MKDRGGGLCDVGEAYLGSGIGKGIGLGRRIGMAGWCWGAMVLSAGAQAGGAGVGTARTLFVDAVRGKDTNAGTAAAPYRTIQAASDVTRPGDTVLIGDGTYLETSGDGVVVIARSGAPGAWITYKPAPGAHPRLTVVKGWNHVVVSGSWIRVEGLEIAGNARNVSVEAAEKVYERFASGPGAKTYGPETSFAETNGIMVRAVNYQAPLRERIAPRHVEIVGNSVHDVQGCGIATMGADWVTVRGNKVENTAGRAMYACSGISLLGSVNTEDGAGYKMVVEQNLVVAARTYVKWITTKAMSDGNGIILDSNRSTQDHGEAYRGRFLVANNVVVGSGGAGVQVFSTDHADVVFNTVYNNSLTPGLEYGQIWVHAATDVKVENNVVVAGPGAKINQVFADNKDVVYDYNVYFGGRKPEMMGPHDLVGDPLFVDAAGGDLRVRVGSPAVGSGVGEFGVEEDFAGRRRVVGTGVDRGAFVAQRVGR